MLKTLCVCFCSLFVLCSCRQYSVIPVNVILEQPAEVNMLPYKRIVFVLGRGKYTPIIAEKLETQLTNSFKILPVDADNFESSVTIKSTYYFDAKEITEDSTISTLEVEKEAARKPDVIKRKRYTRHNKLSMDISFTVRDKNNELISEKKYEPNAVIEENGFVESPQPIDPQSKFEEFITYVVQSFVRTIVPSNFSQKVHIEKLEYEGFPEAVKYARAGNWKDALTIFEEKYNAKADDPVIRAKNVYNYALALQYSSKDAPDRIAQLNRAMKLYEKAHSLAPEFLYKKQQQYCEYDIDRYSK